MMYNELSVGKKTSKIFPSFGNFFTHAREGPSHGDRQYALNIW